ncbi:MAG: ribosome maturation factor RimP [Acidobacteriaceae bacterium]|nr:ribosome maturation factor RimP [Acidobacteriaceae bacterium]
MDLEKVRQAAERVARSEGLEIADVEWKVGKQRFLRVYIDRLPERAAAPDTNDAGTNVAIDSNGAQAGNAAEPPLSNPYPKITHGDCERVSQQLSVILDVEDLIPGPGYILEVSSPGMDRALKKATDFERFRGRKAKIVTTEPVGDAKFFEGRLAGVAPGKVRIELQGKQAKVVEIPLDAIRKANLVVEF